MIEATLYEDLERLIEGLGYRIVELKAQPIRNALMVSLVVHRSGGIGVDDCAIVHRSVLPRLEAVLERDDIRMEVSSPGIGRKLKSWSEFKAFVGEGVTIGLKDGTTETGTITKSDGTRLELTGDGGTQEIDTERIAWARLTDE